MITKEIKVLDHGFVRLIDVMGNDQAIVNAARLSIAGENVRPVSDDRALIRYLLRHRHTTPFEMVEFKFHVKLPIFAARQKVRHRTASINEMSGRYSELPEEFYVPAPENIQFQAEKNKQGRSEEVLPDANLEIGEFADEARVAFDQYRQRLDRGMARELARINLPLSTYTEWFWKIDLHNLFHFLGLRLDAHAQYEIRVYAEAMAMMVKEVCPIAWEAFEDYKLDAITLTGPELAMFRMLFLEGVRDDKVPEADSEDVKIIHASMPTKREAEEFKDKLRKIGITVFSQ